VLSAEALGAVAGGGVGGGGECSLWRRWERRLALSVAAVGPAACFVGGGLGGSGGCRR